MTPQKSYACYLPDADIREVSSSGGVFTAFSEYVLSRKGIVFGVKMSEDCYSAEYTSITDRSELYKLNGSKYIQARMGNTFQQVKEQLTAGRLVLFTGTGCQVNGLRNYLRKDYDNLICMDVICHGVPSPALWKKYVLSLEQKYGSKVVSVNFRAKEIFSPKQGWNNNQLYISKEKDPFMQMFLRDFCLRPSCYHCEAKTVRMSDVTVGDFWGIDQILPESNDRFGCSAVFIRTQKGMDFFNRASKDLKCTEVSYDEVTVYNPAEIHAASSPEQRNTLLTDMHNLDFGRLANQYVPAPAISIKRRIKQMIKKVVPLHTKPKKIDWGTYGILFAFEKPLK